MRLPKIRPLAAVCCAVVGVLTATAACGPSPDDAPTSQAPAATVTITGTGAEAPDLAYPVPLVLDAPVTEVVWEGEGDEVVDGQPVLLRIYSENGADGSVVRDDFTSVPAPYLLTEEAIGSDLFSVLSGQRVGARILHAVETDGVPVVTSIDILPSRAVGELSAPEAGSPVVAQDPSGVPTVTIPADQPAPTAPVVRQVVRGTGEQVTSGSKVVIQFVAVKWSTGEVFDTTWGEGRLPKTVTLGVDQLIEGLDEGLVDLPVGSQVMLVVPPGLGFGPSGNELSTETLVYVVDILAASPAAPLG